MSDTVSIDINAAPPADPVPCFEQTGREVRLGSLVLLGYPAGDCDVAKVTALERFGRSVTVQVIAGPDDAPVGMPVTVDVGALAPYEEEDFDDE